MRPSAPCRGWIGSGPSSIRPSGTWWLPGIGRTRAGRRLWRGRYGVGIWRRKRSIPQFRIGIATLYVDSVRGGDMWTNELTKDVFILCPLLVAIGLGWWGLVFRQKDAGVTFKPFRVLMLSHAFALAVVVVLMSPLVIWGGL